MDENIQVNQFEEEVEKAIQRFRHEYQLSYASIIGVLHLKAFELCKEAWDVSEGGDE